MSKLRGTKKEVVQRRVLELLLFGREGLSKENADGLRILQSGARMSLKNGHSLTNVSVH